jgi:predicted nucleic acid-binding protein
VNVLLDTSAVLAGEIGVGFAAVAVSVITLAEMDYGARLAPTAAERARRMGQLADLRRRFLPLPIDEKIAAGWGDLAAHTAARGRQPRRRAMDLMIAATAQAHGLTLLSLDEDLLWLSDVLDVRRP